MPDHSFSDLLTFLAKVPSISASIARGTFDDGNWWVKFSIDIDHRLSWHVVQELGNILNYLSVNQRLPTVFKPVSPPVYLNGGPRDFLSWVIESSDPAFSPDKCHEWLIGRLPQPVDDPQAWLNDEND